MHTYRIVSWSSGLIVHEYGKS